ncbi:MAG TPA: 30S ribosome-binding factor RbfA [Polyangiaceae bacterium]|jgi:ribosome-binding factor A
MSKQRRSRDSGTRAAGVRSLRIEELFREELNSIIDSEINDPRLDGARVTFVELSRDGSRARVWISRADEDEGALSARELEARFERASGFFRNRLCDALPLKRMPELTFRLDPALNSALGKEQESS